MVTITTARVIVNVVLDNLRDRRGVGDELDAMDFDEDVEMCDELIQEVLRVANGGKA